MAYTPYGYQSPSYGGYPPYLPRESCPAPVQGIPAGNPVQAVQTGQPSGQPGMICRPVASEEEARAVPTDFSGATLVLTDFGHGRVYTKALNYMDGSAIFQVYQLTAPTPPAPPAEYAGKEELEALRAEVAALRARLEEGAKPALSKGGNGK